MPLKIDTSRALRTHAELVALVEAVRDAAAGEPETDSVEWKSDWDITDAGMRFESVRHILGFGNRTVFAAQPTFEGCAYLLAGVEPGNLVGTKVVDPADIDNQLSNYIAPGQPRWSPHYVTVDGKSVLIFVIEAPRQGDPIFTVQKGYDKAPAGRIFVRRHGKTIEAGPAEIRALEARGQAVRPKVELAVTRADEAAVLRAVGLAEEDCERWVAAERERLAIPPPAPPPSRARVTGGFDRSWAMMSGDRRTKAAYVEEVEEYLEQAKVRWLSLVAAASIEHRLAPIELQIVNPTERNFGGTEVVVELPDDSLVWLSADDVDDTLAPPDVPKAWGEERLLAPIGPYVTSAAKALVSFDEVERKGATRRARFQPLHVRPGETVPLPPIYLTLHPDQAGHEITVRWRLTSTGVDGWQEGEATFAVADEPINLEIPNRDPSDDDEE